MERNKIRIIKDFEKKAATYYKKNYLEINHSNFIRNSRREIITDNIDFGKRYKNVMDCGCGPVLLFGNLHEIAENYIAMDISPDNLNNIIKNYKIQSVECILADLDNFKWEGNKFDLIICSGSIEYTNDPLNNLLKLIAYLEINGILIISFPNKVSPYRLWGKFIYSYIYKFKNLILRKNQHIYKNKLFSRKQISKAVEKKNVRIEKCIYNGLKIIPQPFDNLLRVIDFLVMKSGWLNKLDVLNFLKFEFVYILKKY